MAEHIIARCTIHHSRLRKNHGSESLMVGERGTGVQCTAIGSNIGGAHRVSYQLPLRQIE